MKRSERLAEIRARAEAATKPPWVAGNWTLGIGDYVVEAFIGDAAAAEHAATDLAFIAASREDVPWLIDEIARLDGWLREIDQVLDAHNPNQLGIIAELTAAALRGDPVSSLDEQRQLVGEAAKKYWESPAGIALAKKLRGLY